MKSLIPEKYQDAASMALIFILIMIFLGKAIFGAGFSASDNIASESFQPYLKEASAKGEFPQWLPYIFSGMPAYAALLTTGDRTWDMSQFVVIKFSFLFRSVFGSDTARIAFWYAVYGIGMFLLMRSKSQERLPSLFAAIAAVFSTFVIVWVMIGHNTKPVALSMFPYVLMGLEKIRERWSLKYTVLLVFAVHVMVESTHLQMVFYAVCTFALYLLFELISRLITKQAPLGVLRAALVLALAGGMSFAMGADRFMSTIEYTPYSTRGSAPISQVDSTQPQKQGANKQDVNGGNDYEYATNWSFSPAEVSTFFVPNYYGFGKMSYKGPLTNNKERTISTYFGQMPFTDAANYMGIGVLLLALLGAWWSRRDAFVQFLIALSLFSLFLSFGKNLSFLYDLFFYHVPMFNKFRAPSMALAMMQFAVPLLAAYGIRGLMQVRESTDAKSKKIVTYSAVVCAAFLLLGLVYPSMDETSYRESVKNSESMTKQYEANIREALSGVIYDEMKSDWQATGLIAVLFAAAMLLYARKNITSMIFFPVILVLLVFDLWRVGYRPMEVPKKKIESEVFKRTDLIDFLQRDTSAFRIADLGALPSPNVAAYFKLENIHGYHSAKMRAYQDLLDEAGLGGGSNIVNPLLWNVLNVKYVLSPQLGAQGVQPVFTSNTGVKAYLNPIMMQRAQFVKHAAIASKTKILEHLRLQDFNPHDTAWLEEALPVAIDVADSTATATLVERRNEYQKYMVNASGNNLLHVSEIYYPVSWRALLDGAEIPIYRTNYALRSVVIPKGQHTLEFVYRSPKFEQGKTLSLTANLLLVIGAAAVVFMDWKRKKDSKANG